MKKLIISTIATVTAVAGLSCPVQAGTENCIDSSLYSKRYVISGECVNGNDELKFVFSDFGTCFQGGIWNQCPIIVFPITGNPDTDGNNDTEADVPEVNIPDTNEPETNDSNNNDQNTVQPDSGEQQTTTTENTTTIISGITEQETTIPETDSSTVGSNGCNRPIIIQIPNKPGTNESETGERETTKPSANTPSTGNGSSVTETPSTPEQNTQQLSYAEQVVKLVNQERVKAGLKEVTLDKQIEAAALIRAKEIEISFSHTRPNGSSFSSVLKEQGISFRGAGENIAWGQSSPEAVMNAWMNSEGHRANILNPNFTKIGVGYYQNSSGRKFWTQLFTY